ncbi:MAG: hypothetical protein IPG21_03905 [Saprospiraceae bacterium]|nr:hypothetical protein [Candidatus Vicinibacter affinis]
MAHVLPNLTRSEVLKMVIHQGMMWRFTMIPEIGRVNGKLIRKCICNGLPIVQTPEQSTWKYPTVAVLADPIFIV